MPCASAARETDYEPGWCNEDCHVLCKKHGRYTEEIFDDTDDDTEEVEVDIVDMTVAPTLPWVGGRAPRLTLILTLRLFLSGPGERTAVVCRDDINPGGASTILNFTRSTTNKKTPDQVLTRDDRLVSRSGSYDIESKAGIPEILGVRRGKESDWEVHCRFGATVVSPSPCKGKRRAWVPFTDIHSPMDVLGPYILRLQDPSSSSSSSPNEVAGARSPPS